MPTFHIELDDGRAFEVDADTEAAAAADLSKHLAGGAVETPADRALAKAPNGYVPFLNDLAHKVTQGMTLGWGDELSAAARSIAPNTTYAKEKAIQDAIEKRATKNTGALGVAAEIAGGVGTGSTAARGGATLMRAGQSFLPRVLAGLTEGAGYGAAAGAGNSEDRLSGALRGAGYGATAGAALPTLAAAARPFVSPAISNLTARFNPDAYAERVIAKDLAASGLTRQQVAQKVADANAAGQPFTLADAMGVEGEVSEAQRRLVSVAKAPGKGRADTRRFLEQRQEGQAERVGDIVEEGLGVSGTGRQEAARLGQQARKDAGPLYEKSDAYPIQWDKRLGEFINDPIAQAALQRGMKIQRLEALASGQPFNPADYTIAGFNKAASQPGVLAAGPNMRTLDAIKKGLDDLLEQYRDKTTGRLVLDAEGRAIEQVRKAYVKHLDSINPEYAGARRAWAGPTQESEAIGLGKQWARSGRAEDNVGVYNDMNPSQQAGARAGYADTLVAQIDRARRGVNAAGPFTSRKTGAEMGAMSQYQGPLMPGAQDELARRLEREGVMYQTRNQALGGSQTAENLADMADTGVDPAIIASIMRGDFVGALKTGGLGVLNQASGNTEPVREALARKLLGLDGEDVGTLLRRASARLRGGKAKADRIERGMIRGLLSGGAELQ
jgi:hypothetical protein